MEKLKNMGLINEAARKNLKPYLEKLLEIHGENVVSVVVYGSATGEDFIPKKSDVNLLFVLKNLSLADLKKSLKVVSKGISKKISAPLFFTRSYIESSTDVFPVEFLEMKENHVVICGEEVLGELEIKWDNIRLQCEQQLKGKLIRLRQAYLEIGLAKKGMEALLKESLTSLIPIFRNLIRLKKKTPPVEKEGVIKALSQEFEVDADIFIAILRDKSNDEKIGSHDVEPFFERYVEEIRKLAVAVDKL